MFSCYNKMETVILVQKGLSLRIKLKARHEVIILILFQKSQKKQLEAHLSSCFAQQFNIQGRRSSSRSSSEYGL